MIARWEWKREGESWCNTLFHYPFGRLTIASVSLSNLNIGIPYPGDKPVRRAFLAMAKAWGKPAILAPS
jgi:hypothetical protein